MNIKKQKALGKAMLCELALYCLYSLIYVLAKKYTGALIYTFTVCILTALLFVIPTLVYIKITGTAPTALIYPNEQRADKKTPPRLNSALGFVIGLSITVSAVNIVSLGTDSLFKLLGTGASASEILSNSELITMLLRNVLISAAAEELLLRGVVLDATRSLPNSKRILISALLFALIHCNARSFFYAFAAGATIAYFTIMYNSVIFGFALHFSQNLITFAFTFLSQTLKSNTYSLISKICFTVFLFTALLGTVALAILRHSFNVDISTADKADKKENFYISTEMTAFVVFASFITLLNF